MERKITIEEFVSKHWKKAAVALAIAGSLWLGYEQGFYIGSRKTEPVKADILIHTNERKQLDITTRNGETYVFQCSSLCYNKFTDNCLTCKFYEGR